MNRRDFTKWAGLSAVAFGCNALPAIASTAAPQFSITMDDFNWRDPVKLTAVERNQALLQTLRGQAIKAALFVVGRNVEANEGKQLLAPWIDAGHMIGNHTYSHPNFNAPRT